MSGRQTGDSAAAASEERAQFNTAENGEHQQDSENEAIYQRALELQEHTDSYEDQIAAQNLFQSIFFYKDADRHVTQCNFRAWEIRWDKRKSILKIAIPAAILAVILVIVGINVNKSMAQKRAAEQANAYKYSQAEQLVENGEYELAIDEFVDLGDYRDSAERAQAVREIAEQEQIDALKQAQVGDKVFFGFYEDHDSQRYGLQWTVLAAEDRKLLLISHSTVELMPFNDAEDNPNWQDSSLRTWLNGEFLDKAFTENERAMVTETDITCQDGSTVQDYCFVLSAEEARNLFPETDDSAINSDRSSTDNWWLRTATSDGMVEACWMNGSLFLDGYKPTATCGVRPVVWVSI